MDIACDLKLPLAVISGGLGDIGSAIAMTFARAGSDIAIGDLQNDKLATSLLNEVGKCGVRGFYRPLDVSDFAATEAWYDHVAQYFGRTPNVIVANAAVVTTKPLLQLTAEEWSRELQVNLTGSYFFSRIGAKRLQQQMAPGRIVFLGSWAGHAPHQMLPAYSIAKAGLRMLNQCLALELASSGILVNEIAPGYVNAGLSGQIFQKDPAAKKQAQEGVPIQKLLRAEDVAAQALFLCSEYASHMTGTTLLQDGGLSLLWGPQSE